MAFIGVTENIWIRVKCIPFSFYAEKLGRLCTAIKLGRGLSPRLENWEFEIFATRSYSGMKPEAFHGERKARSESYAKTL